jgi:predicted GTPase
VVENQPFVVVGNKIDLERKQQAEHAQQFADLLKAPYLETSALDGSGVADLFETLAQLSLPE